MTMKKNSLTFRRLTMSLIALLCTAAIGWAGNFDSPQELSVNEDNAAQVLIKAPRLKLKPGIAGDVDRDGSMTITDVTTSNGHVTGLTAHTFTLPAAQTVSDTYTAVAASGTSLGGVQEVSALDSVAYSTKQYVSDTLNITNTAAGGVNKINFEIAWGTF